MHEELGTKPFIHYLYETPAVPGRDPLPSDMDDDALADPENPLVGQLQRFWDFRAAANFILGGMGSGLAAAAAAPALAVGLSDAATRMLLFASGVLMAAGLGFVFFKIGRKLRALYALRRPQSSWMTREIYAAAAFYPLLALDLWRPHLALHALVGLAALGFLYCQARILFASKGVPTWRARLIPGLLVASGLYEGIGLAAIGLAFLSSTRIAGDLTAGFGVVMAVVTANLWCRYRATLKDQGAGPFARSALAAVAPVLQGVGYTVPALAFAAAMFASSDYAPWLAAAAGGLAAISGGLMKYVIIVRAGYQQGFALAKLPRRGSGARAAPPSVLARAAAE
jgi:phenylacetyl-CoA:acceptor oxidoreductase subunit 2